MALNPTALLDRSISDLQDIATLFATELERVRAGNARSARDLRRKEALLTISVLLPKLAAVRALEAAQDGTPPSST